MAMMFLGDPRGSHALPGLDLSFLAAEPNPFGDCFSRYCRNSGGAWDDYKASVGVQVSVHEGFMPMVLLAAGVNERQTC